MNGEKAAFQTPTFALKRQRTLDTLIRDIYAEHCSDHKVVRCYNVNLVLY